MELTALDSCMAQTRLTTPCHHRLRVPMTRTSSVVCELRPLRVSRISSLTTSRSSTPPTRWYGGSTMLATWRLLLAVAAVLLATVVASCGQSEVTGSESAAGAASRPASEAPGDSPPTGQAEAEAPPAQATDPQPTDSEPQPVVFSEWASTTPSESLTDWVNLSLFAVVVEIESESTVDPTSVIPPSEPVGMAASIGNTYQGTVVEAVWQDEDGELRTGDKLEFAGFGWVATKDEEGFIQTPYFPYLEVGKRYLVALAQHFEGIGPLGQTSAIPISDSGMVEEWVIADIDGNTRLQPGVAPGLAADERLETTQDFVAALGELPVPIEIRRASSSAINRHSAITQENGGE